MGYMPNMCSGMIAASLFILHHAGGITPAASTKKAMILKMRFATIRHILKRTKWAQ